MDNTARNFIDHLERDILETKDLLQSGLENALERIGSAAEKATTVMTVQAIAKLRAVEAISEESIDAIQKHLGKLNYLAAEGDIKSSDDFDQLAQPLSEALHDARSTLAKLDEIGQRELGGVAGAIGEAWRHLHLALDSARLELALAKKGSEEEANSLRQDLIKRFEAARQVAKVKAAKPLGDKLHDIALSQVTLLGDCIKILFFLPTENPDGQSSPAPDERSIETKVSEADEGNGAKDRKF